MLLDILQWTWCLPQTLLGLVLKLCWKGKRDRYWFNNQVYIVYNTTKKNLGGISLGKYILLGANMDTEKTIKHEYGHQLQSYILGPLYLLVIGLPSGLWCWFVQD